ncbi:MAG: caspase family protein [Treponema sp.]|nr:caspase family protein [Treponema sp.]
MKKFVIAGFLLFVIISLCAAAGIRDNYSENLQRNLWILAIGVNEYSNITDDSGYINLISSSSDAAEFLNTLKSQEGKYYNTVFSLSLTDNDSVPPTKQAILESLAFFKQSQPNDTIMLFLSGLGKSEDGLFFFLPQDTIFTGTIEIEHDSVINMNELAAIMNDFKGRKILFIDSCGAGAAINSFKNQRNTVVFAASLESEVSYENALYGGIFAYSLIEGLNGKAANNGFIDLLSLFKYVNEQVIRLSFDRNNNMSKQTPVIFFPPGFRDYVISAAE